MTDYNHFGDAQRGKCPLHENVEDRHEQEVKKAAEEAMAKVRADHPGLSNADLMVKVSDRVKQAEDARKGQAIAEAQRFPYRMVGDELRRFPLPLPQAVGRPVQPPPALQYVPLHLPFIRELAFGFPFRPFHFHRPFYPLEPGNYFVGALPQPQHPQVFPGHLAAPCPHCNLYHPPNHIC